jgi:hypothetical protein
MGLEEKNINRAGKLPDLSFFVTRIVMLHIVCSSIGEVQYSGPYAEGGRHRGR